MATQTAVLAGGCFWCIEADLEKCEGVLDVVSGYTGGDTQHPTYENYAAGGHREAAKITYNPEKICFRELVAMFLKHIDPTDPEGSFADRGVQYSPALYYETEEEKHAAEEVLAEIASHFDKPLTVPVLPRKEFWEAEEYHQDFSKKNPEQYKQYRKASGREAFFARWNNNKK